MPQHPKDEVRASIVAAALQVFAERGFASATMAEIARAARVSAANIYGYFPSKERLFRAAVPHEFVRDLRRRMTRKVQELDEVPDIGALSPSAEYRVLSEELLQFWIANRERIVILLRGADGTAHEGFVEQMVQHLVLLALAYLATIRPEAHVIEPVRFALTQIYRNLIGAYAAVLVEHRDEATIREAVGHLSAYHLAGLRHMFEIAPVSRSSRKSAVNAG